VEADDADLLAVRVGFDCAAFPAKQKRRDARELARTATTTGAFTDVEINGTHPHRLARFAAHHLENGSRNVG